MGRPTRLVVNSAEHSGNRPAYHSAYDGGEESVQQSLQQGERAGGGRGRRPAPRL